MLHIVRLDRGPYYLSDFNGRVATWTKDPRGAWELRGVRTTEAICTLIGDTFPAAQCLAQSNMDPVIAAITKTQEFKDPTDPTLPLGPRLRA